MNLNIDIPKWAEFRLDSLFDVKGTKTTKIEELEYYGEGCYPYVTTQSSNNGVAGRYNYYTENGNVLTIDSAVAGFCSYQRDNFSASDHVEKLVPKFSMNKYHAYFFVCILNRERFKYSYGRKANHTKIRNTILKLPVNDELRVDLSWIEAFIKSLSYKEITTSISSKCMSLKIEEWGEFFLGDLFEIIKGKRLTKADMIPGNLNFLGVISENNGVREKIESDLYWEGNCITVNCNGSVGEAFYQGKSFMHQTT